MISSAEEFVRLRSSDKPEEYQRAGHDDAPDDIWLEVIKNYPDYREWVAYNKSVPPHILKMLAMDPDVRVRSQVAMRRKAGEDMLLLLARDPDFFVRQRVVNNPKVSRKVLEIMAADIAPEIASRALAKLKKHD